MAVPIAYARSHERVVRLCEAGGDSRSLRVRLLDELRTATGFDAYAFLLTDPETAVGCSPVADVPCLPELPKMTRLKYLTALDRWTALDGVALLSDLPDPSRNLLWRELLRDYGVRDIASLVFKDRFGCWGFLDLYRCDRAFSAAEAAYLARLTAPVSTALRRIQAGTFVVRPSHAPRPGPLVLLLSPDLLVLAQTPETYACLSLLVPPEHGRPAVPASAYNVAAQLLALEAGVDAHPPRSRVHLADGLWLTLSAARIGDAAPQARRRAIAVTIEETSPTERLAVFARAFALSPREGDLLSHLARGGDNHTVACRMSLSELTVQDHLKSIFAKTSTNTRGMLLARALGA
ncbi:MULTISPECIES: LuxR C-terminal-related transcriptional regulator [unclassified Streptomyces]|uniref:LuxR C-terminal-related transcriptional regulator n=1 Tax=unclassified Streptomyces TaxID=2593676 RepID=UPI002366AC68|nr:MULTISPECIES: LuxR C-terminal-related transcriptional regulator [unclassified Streptomyces]MDF3145321.1 LuxR C-terminal-related transcriptional regulator [Streptomyces sp. T21Q-yed]WDF38941.1 LuxR C-terminal-related transcriptional regulator [Streptomyces sp. T12]